MKFCGAVFFLWPKMYKTLKLDKIEHFCGKTCSIHKILKIYTDSVTYVFLRRPSTEEKKLKNNH